MDNLQLFEAAGRPSRAVLEFSQPVTYFTGRKVATDRQFTAYVQAHQGSLYYFFTPKARRGYQVPAGLVNVTPAATPSYFKSRLDHAVRCILADRIHGRELDAAFENDDGDQMVTAIIRRARKNPRLDETIRRQFSTQKCDWYDIATLRDGLTDAELEAEADQQRRISHNIFYLTWAIQDGRLESYQKT